MKEVKKILNLLDNAPGLTKVIVAEFPGLAPVHCYKHESGNEMRYSLECGANTGVYHLLTFDKGSDNQWFRYLLKTLKHEFGPFNDAFTDGDIICFVWYEGEDQ